MRLRLITVMFLAVCFTAACVPVSDPIEQAYKAYANRRDECESLPDRHQCQACQQVNVQQFQGAVENAANNWEKWQPPSQWRPDPPRVETRTDIMPKEPYTPPLPQAGPTKASAEKGRLIEDAANTSNAPEARQPSENDKEDPQCTEEDPGGCDAVNSDGSQ